MDDNELEMLQEGNDDPSEEPVLIVCDNVLSVIDIDNIEVNLKSYWHKICSLPLKTMQFYRKSNYEPSDHWSANSVSWPEFESRDPRALGCEQI